MSVICQNVLGSQVSIYVDNLSENRATNAVLRRLNRDYPGMGWMALRVEHGRKVIW